MKMRFTIEQRHLTDASGRPVSEQNAVSFHLQDADTLEEAVRLFVQDQQGELIGDVLKFPGFQAVATVRRSGGVFTLQITPASQQISL